MKASRRLEKCINGSVYKPKVPTQELQHMPQATIIVTFNYVKMEYVIKHLYLAVVSTTKVTGLSFSS